MEVEVKLRINSKEGHSKLAEVLKDGYQETHNQENFFFDGADQELSDKRVTLRLRFYDTDKRAVLTLKGRMQLADGVGKALEDEDDVEPLGARKYLEEPDSLLRVESPVIIKAKSLASPAALVCLGGFTNIRKVFAWEGYTLELDETQYEWGTLYELECETAQPEKAKQDLEKLMEASGIDYKYSSSTKFKNFRNRTLE